MTDSNNSSKPDFSIWSLEKIRKLFEEKFDKERESYKEKRPNILVVGFTGSGKTTLCQKIFGDEIVPDGEVGWEGEPKTKNFKFYENDFVGVWDSRGMELNEGLDSFKDSLRAFIDERNSQPNVDDHIHLVWLTVQGCGGRLDPKAEGDLFHNILDPKRTFLVITKSDITKDRQKEGLLKVATEKISIPPKQIFFVSERDDDSGVLDLIRRSHELLPEAYKMAFVEAQMRDVEMKRKQILGKNAKAKALIVAAGAAAATVCAAPIPIASGTILVPTQIGLIASLAALYDVGSGAALKQSALPLVARVAGMWAASELSKLIPGFGSVISATVGSSLTIALGWYVQKQFEVIALANAEGREPPEPIFDWNEFLNFKETFRQ